MDPLILLDVVVFFAFVITVVAVTLSAVISNNIEDDAIRRYEARAKQEATALTATAAPTLLPARLLAAALRSTTSPEVRQALARVTNPPAGRSEAIGESTE